MSVSSMIGHALTDEDGRFLSVDANFCEVLQMPSAELTACSLLDVTYREDRGHNIADLDRLRLTGEAFVIRKRYVRPSGKLVWVENHVSLFRDGLGPPRLIAASRELVGDDVARARARPLLRFEDLAPHLHAAFRDALVEALERHAAQGSFPLVGDTLSATSVDTLVRIANSLMEAYDETALDDDPATRKLIEAVLLHVGRRLTEGASALRFGTGAH
ncbi:hypothetical protein GCM10011390_14750 [Aureimonas endophytica]|uniref:PAS fold-3 domain-containing protein n=1 Tax=Aureimonas endophytica TaxID=2027858 RepID=A0A917E227_9HYPH|nr:PAS domain-containing protein [Aureimonas endophytica]GGD97038.1 hypothetical protein GCM10011390_14750 [Aureimonas endophytica]